MLKYTVVWQKEWNMAKLGILAKRKARFFLMLVLLSVTIFYLLNIQGWHWYKMVEQIECETPENYMGELRKLFVDAHHILDEFKLTHVLIYGRYSIPWKAIFLLLVFSVISLTYNFYTVFPLSFYNCDLISINFATESIAKWWL